MQQNGKKRDMISEQPLYKNERRKHKLNTQLVFAHKQYLDYDHLTSSFYHPQPRLQKGSVQISINHSRDPLSGSIAAGMIWIKRLILPFLAGCSEDQCSYFVKDQLRDCTYLRQVEWWCMQYHSLAAPLYFIFRLSGCAYTAKLESIFSQVSVLKAVSVWSLLETNSPGMSQQLSRRRIMAPLLKLACRSSYLAAYRHTLCFLLE